MSNSTTKKTKTALMICYYFPPYSLVAALAGIALLFFTTVKGQIRVTSKMFSVQMKYVIPLAAAGLTGISFRKVFPWSEGLKFFSVAGFCGMLIIPVYFVLPLGLLRVSTIFVLYSMICIFALFRFKILRDDEKGMLFMPLNFLRTQFLKVQ